jgi:hypothetical protein
MKAIQVGQGNYKFKFKTACVSVRFDNIEAPPPPPGEIVFLFSCFLVFLALLSPGGTATFQVLFFRRQRIQRRSTGVWSPSPSVHSCQALPSFIQVLPLLHFRTSQRDICFYLKGQCHQIFHLWFFFFKQLLLAPIDKPSNDFDFFRILAKIFDFSGASPVSLTPAKQTILL